MNATLAAQQQFIKTRKKRIVGALPFIFAELIFTFVYYVFVVRWIPTLFALQVESAVAQVLLFHVLFVLCQASFFKTTLTDPGSIPDGYLEHVRPFFSIFSPSLSSSPTSFFFTPLNPFSFHPSLIPINTEENWIIIEIIRKEKLMRYEQESEGTTASSESAGDHANDAEYVVVIVSFLCNIILLSSSVWIPIKFFITNINNKCYFCILFS